MRHARASGYIAFPSDKPQALSGTAKQVAEDLRTYEQVGVNHFV
jgi:hypothetical protein